MTQTLGPDWFTWLCDQANGRNNGGPYSRNQLCSTLYSFQTDNIEVAAMPGQYAQAKPPNPYVNKVHVHIILQKVCKNNQQKSPNM